MKEQKTYTLEEIEREIIGRSATLSKISKGRRLRNAVKIGMFLITLILIIVYNM